MSVSVYNECSNVYGVHSWFHGNISRDDAEKMLRPFKNGQYIVRESQNYKGDYTLCVR